MASLLQIMVFYGVLTAIGGIVGSRFYSGMPMHGFHVGTMLGMLLSEILWQTFGKGMVNAV